jgi:hypothetical protein
MKTLGTTVRRLVFALLFLSASIGFINPVHGADPPEDPEFDPLVSLQKFQQSYANQEIMPQNNTNTGAATFAITVKVTPGRGGLQPGISLSYSSSAKNGWVGVGWNLDLGSIQRATKRGLDYGGSDFLYNGSTELISRADWGADFYGARIEEGFSKFYFDSSTGGWEITAKDGTRYFYGSSLDSRQHDPDNTARVFKWCLVRVEDTNGNTMSVDLSFPHRLHGRYELRAFYHRVAPRCSQQSCNRVYNYDCQAAGSDPGVRQQRARAHL